MSLRSNQRALPLKGGARFLFSSVFFLSCTFASLTGHAEPAVMSDKAQHSLLLDGTQTAGLMVVVGERGHIIYSHDNGEQWTQANVPTRALLTGVHMHNKQLGWAVGHDATILRTNDGAKTWQLVYSAPEEESPLLDVWFRDANSGYAIGAYGLFLETDDGGEHWQQRRVSEEDDYHLNHITALDEHTLFIAAEAGVAYRSDDGGENWQALESPYHGSFFGSLALGEQQLILFGLRGHLFKSDDNGDTWQDAAQLDTNAMFTAALKTEAGKCFVSGLSGVLLINDNCDGKNFRLHQFPDRSGIAAMLDVGNGEIILIGEHGIKRFKP